MKTMMHPSHLGCQEERQKREDRSAVSMLLEREAAGLFLLVAWIGVLPGALHEGCFLIHCARVADDDFIIPPGGELERDPIALHLAAELYVAVTHEIQFLPLLLNRAFMSGLMSAEV